MKQLQFFKASKKEHGGILSHRKRRSRRPLTTKYPIHFTLRSDFAYGPRSLLKHRLVINRIGKKFSKRFGVRIYRQAICGNHLHLCIRGRTREGLQNFFRVFAGLIAQEILATAPLSKTESQKKSGGAPQDHESNQTATIKKPTGCEKNRRRFWALLTYTRIMTWGREFKNVCRYIQQNTLEALHIIAYKPRKQRPFDRTWSDTG